MSPTRYLILAALLTVAVTTTARPVVTRTLCNYQTEPMAIVDDGEKIRVGWQYTDDARPTPVIQEGYHLRVTERHTGHVVFDSGIVNSSESQFIELSTLPHNRYGYAWKVRIAVSGTWSDWSPEQTIRITPPMGTPQWIGAITKRAAGIPDGRWSNNVFKKDTFQTKWTNVDTLSARSIVLRKVVTPHKPIADAVVYVSGLGHYEFRINGQRVGDSQFAPLWSEYSRTVYFNTFDVTSLLASPAPAVLSVLLGNGFFNVQRGGRYSKLQTSFGPPQLFLRLDITYADGTTDCIVSDSTWHWAPSPVTFNSIYGGESYDARLEQPDSHQPSFDDSRWAPAVVTEGPGGCLRPETCQPVKIMEYFDPVAVHYIAADSLDAASRATRRTVHPSAFVCDMGQNLAGFPVISVTGRPGQKVTLIVSERLTPQGVCDQSQTGRQHYYEYTIGAPPPSTLRPAVYPPEPPSSPLRPAVYPPEPPSSPLRPAVYPPEPPSSPPSSPLETWHPRFSYYGFRYIQVEGAVMEGQPNPEGLPVLHRLQSCFVYNSAAETSVFWCDNDLFTRTHRLIERAERSNMQAVLTDCPHREKLGWLEQDHLCGPSLLYNFDMTRMIPKIIRDIVDTQNTNGMVPTTAPQYVSFGDLFDDSPEWGSTLIILPFQYYDFYGDSTLIVDNYDAMRRYVDYLSTRADSGIVSHGLGDWYDYGPWRAGFSRNTPVALVATAHYIYDLQLLTEAARMTGRTADQQHYATLCQEVTRQFNRRFYHPDSCYYGSGSQCSNALPLFLGICGDNQQAVLQSLISDIHAHGDRLTTGDVGNRYLFRVLADNGYSDLLFRMLNHYETPGYGFQLRQGATTLTEQWDPRQGASENHFMLGQIDEWLFRSLAGIRQQPGTHGFRHVLIDPHHVGDISRVRASIQTIYGPLSVSVDHASPTPVEVVLPSGCKMYP